MRCKIYYVVNGFEDSIIIDADDITELRAKAKDFVESRNAEDYWSEML